MIYLDYAAATPVDNRVLAAMNPYWQERFYNPSALYRTARQLKQDLETARVQAAGVLGAKAREVYFTAGATEANNMALAGVMRRYPDGNLLCSAIEHDAIRQTAQAMNGGEVPVKTDGRVDSVALKKLVDDQTVLVSIEYVNSEIGVIQPVREISRIIRELRQDRKERGIGMPLYLHTDASQALDCLSVNVADLGVDMATINGAKIYAPKQSGLLYVAGNVELRPLLYGGLQERGLRAGTENIAFSVGLAHALDIANQHHRERTDSYRELQTYLLGELETIPDSRLNGSRKYRIPTNVNMGFAGVDGEMLIHHMDAHGILVATGAACTANYDTPSHVLTAIGIEEQFIQGSIRITFGRDTFKSDVRQTVCTLREILDKMRTGR